MRKIFSRIRNVLFDTRFTPVILLLLCLLSYGIFVPVTGFFIDDWYFMWFKHFFGALQFPAYYGVDRPFQGFFYPVASFILAGSESPIVWGLFAVILRWFCTLALWGTLKTLWPKSNLQNSLVAILAAVFPGFTQHWFVIQYSYYYACLAFFFLSNTLMIKAIREPKKFWIYYPLSIMLGFYSMTSEFFFGLELIRPIILYIEFKRIDQTFGKLIVSIIKYWGAFLVAFIGFAIWRFLFVTGVNHQVVITNAFLLNPFGTMLSILRSLFQSVIDSVINAWAYPFNFSNYPQKGAVSILILSAMAVVFVNLSIWLLLSRRKKTVESPMRIYSWRREGLLLSITSLIFAGIPFLVAGLKIDYLGFNNRFLLAYLFGSCLLIVLIFDFIFSWTRSGVLTSILRASGLLVCTLLVAVAVGYQISNANFYKNVWIRQRELFWQLDWRIPGLQPGTTLFTYSPDSEGDMYSGNALTAQLDWTYSSGVINRQVDYQFIILDSGQGKLIESLDQNVPIYIDFRTYVFRGNTSQSIYVYLPTLGCLRILDQDLNPPETVLWNFNIFQPTQKTINILASTALTDLNLILKEKISQNNPPLQVLGNEISHTWCYFFEKAEVARQFGEYEKVISLLDEATSKGYTPLVDTEWYPFIDAFARTGDWQNAELITTRLASQDDATLHLGLCYLWQKLAKDFTDSNSPRNTTEIINAILECKK